MTSGMKGNIRFHLLQIHLTKDLTNKNHCSLNQLAGHVNDLQALFFYFKK